jgi:subtilase family serine protease
MDSIHAIYFFQSPKYIIMKVLNSLPKIILVVVFLCILNVSYSQIQEGGAPYSYSVSSTALRKNSHVEKMPEVDVSKLRQEDESNKNQNIPFRFGKTFNVDYSLSNSGTWEELANGDRLWTLNLESPGAHSINLTFGEYFLPAGAKLFIFNKEKSMHIGAFTSANNQEDGKLGTRPVKGDAITIEYYEPQYVRGQGKLNISNITHAYKDIFYEQSTGFNGSAECHINVNCPDGAEFQNEKRSVVLIMMNGSLCSGALINNTSQDGTPYVLTARHCFTSEPSTWVFVFNYESPDCSNINGPLNQSIAGADPKAGDGDSDFFLVELSSRPPQSYNAYYAGWSRSTVAPTSGVSIHHPAGDIKKISTSNSSLTKGGWKFSILQSHWIVNSWNNGSNEGGSSGSPVFDQNKRIVGQLQGGTVTTCPGSAVMSYYGGIFYSWDKGSYQHPDGRLRDWLDPGNTGAISMDGSYLENIVCSTPLGSNSIISSSNPVCAGNIFKLSISNIPAGTGIVYQWQSSSDGNLWADINGADDPSIITSQTSSTYYRCNLTCSGSTVSSSNLLVAVNASSCSFNMPSTGDDTIYVCGGFIYDNGGTSNYLNNSNGTITISPSIPGNKIKLNFTSFRTQTNTDYLTIYDGMSVSSPRIEVPYHGTLDSPPAFVTASGSSGSLTLKFTSNASTNDIGFAATISCEPNIPPDLVMQSPALTYTTISAGSSANVSCTISNQSTASSITNYAGFYLSADNVYDVGDLYLGQLFTNSIVANGNLNLSGSVIIPGATTPGNYYILFVADRLARVWEADETNNYGAIAVVITPQAPDLIIQSVSAQAGADAGASLPFSCTVRNQGLVAAISSNVGIYLSENATYELTDVFLGSAAGGSLNATTNAIKSVTLTIPSNTIPGNYYILSFADYDSLSSEGNNDNNINSKAIAITPIGTNVNVPASGSQTVNMCSGFVHDNGGVNASYASSSNGRLTIIPAVKGNKIKLVFTAFDLQQNYDYLEIYNGNSTSAPLIGSYTQTTSPGTVYGANPSGAITLKFVSDNLQNYPGFSATVSCVAAAPMPDLIIQSPSVNKTTIGAGGVVTASCIITNSGTAVSASSNIGFYLSSDDAWDISDISLGNVTGGSLTASQNRSSNLTIPIGTTPGEYHLIYFADFSNVAYELNETNNYNSRQIIIAPAARDLVVVNPIVNYSTRDAGTSLNVESNVKNQGNSPTPSTNMGYYLSSDITYDASDVLLNTSTFMALSEGSTSIKTLATLTIPNNTVAGDYFLLFFADHQNTVSESDETNNIYHFSLKVLPFGNTILVPYSGSNTIARCSGTIYDYAGMDGYLTNANGILTVNPETPGDKVRLNFASFNTNNSNDILHIYNGTSTSDPLIGSYTGAALPGINGVVYGSGLSGALTLRFVTDGSAHSTGFAADLSCVSTIPQPDLIIQSPIVPPSHPAGSVMSTSCTIYNQGDAPAQSWDIRFYLSTNSTYDVSDTYLSSVTGGQLNESTGDNSTYFFTIPSNTPIGDYYIIYQADFNSAILEKDETNNFNSALISITDPQVDFAISNISISSNTIDVGLSTNVSCILRNQGGASSSTSNLAFYLSSDASIDASDIVLATSNGGTLAAAAASNRSAVLTIPANTTPGTYYLILFADYTLSENEFLESNNLSINTLTIRPENYTQVVPFSGVATTTTCLGVVSDHAGSNTNYSSNANGILTIYPAGANSKVKLTITQFSLENNWDFLAVYNGNSTAAASMIGEYTGTVILSNFTSSSLDGSLTLRFRSDNSGTLPGFAANISCVYSDLIIQSPTVTPGSFTAGSTISVSSTIKNQGNLSAGSSNVAYYLSEDNVYDPSDVLLGMSTGNALAASTSAIKSSSFVIPNGTLDGSYYILFFADHTGLISENDETNNVNSVSVTIVPSTMDLEILSPLLSSNTVLKGATVAVSSDIKNVGSVSTPSSNVGYYLSSDVTWDINDVYLGSTSGASLSSGISSERTTTITIPSTTSSGNYYLLFFADFDGMVSENDESNNLASTAITITEPTTVNLYIISPMVSATSVVKGAPANVSFALHNSGTGEASSSKVGYYLSEDAVWDDEDVVLGSTLASTLASDESNSISESITIPAETIEGNYFILFYADYDGSVSESDETNNVSSVAIVVLSPTIDLVIKSPELSEGTIKPGGSVVVSYNIKNFGSINSSSSNVAFYLSLDNIWDVNDVFLNNSNGSVLESMSSSNRSGTLIIPAETIAGDYYILFFADYENSESESLEDNNVGSSAITVIAPNALAQPLSSIIRVNPNPTDGAFEFTYEGLNSANAEIFIYNPLGVLIEQKIANVNNGNLVESLDLTSYPADIYTMKILYEDKQAVVKIVVQ